MICFCSVTVAIFPGPRHTKWRESMLACHDGTTHQNYHKVMRNVIIQCWCVIFPGEPYGIKEKPMYGMRIGTYMVVPFLPWLILGVSYGAQGNMYIVHLCTRAFLRTGGATNELFPFGFVQLGTNAEQKTDNSPDSSWPLIRWHQTADHGIAPNMWVSEKILMATNV